MNFQFTSFGRKVRVGLAALAVSATMSACDELIQIEPENALAPSTIFSDPGRIDAAAAGLYNSAQSGFYDPLNGTGNQTRGYPFGAFYVQAGDARGEDITNTQQFFLIIAENTQNSNSANTVNYWANLYALINQANVFEAGVSGAGISDELKNSYIGEARFMRAISHLELVTYYARPYNHTADASHMGVIIRTTPINSPATLQAALTIPRSTVAEVYTQILADLDYAETNLPITRSGNSNVTRATRAAAIAMKVRVRMMMGQWAAAITEGNKLVPAGTVLADIQAGATGLDVGLNASLSSIYAETGDNREMILAIENNAQDNAGVNGSISTFYTGTVPNAPAGGRGLLAISPNFWNNTSFWLCDDARRSLTALQANPTSTSRHTTKYPNFTTLEDWTPIIRYAEVVLYVAEAEARVAGLGNAPNARAIALLNAVRNRGVGAGRAFTAADFANNQALIQAIINERRIEFLAEGNRWRDIYRLSVEGIFVTPGVPAKARPNQVLQANYDPDPCDVTPFSQLSSGLAPAVPYDDFRFIWGIPLSETINNPALRDPAQQNPGY